MDQEKIGENAGLIWHYLDNNGESSLTLMQKELKITEQELYLALGWLARENKVVVFENHKQYFALLVF